MKINKLFEEYKSVIFYLFFGVSTTAVNIITYWFLAHLFHADIVTATVFAWLFAVAFAYITNRRWVFGSAVSGVKSILFEMATFFACRFATGIIDWICMLVFADYMKFNDLVVKLMANIVVIVLNYVAGKLVVFQKKERSSLEADI